MSCLCCVRMVESACKMGLSLRIGCVSCAATGAGPMRVCMCCVAEMSVGEISTSRGEMADGDDVDVMDGDGDADPMENGEPTGDACAM